MQVRVFYRRINEGVVDHTSDRNTVLLLTKQIIILLHGNISAVSQIWVIYFT